MRQRAGRDGLARVALAAAAVAVWMQAGAGALKTSLTEADIARALQIGNGTEAERARFHAPYILPVKDTTIEAVEIVSEFRRYVMAAEEQIRLGNWTVARGSRSLGGRGIVDDLQPWKERVSIQTRVRFHPQNTYTSVPPFENVVGDPPIAPLDVTRSPLLGLASARAPNRSLPLTGAVVDAVFDVSSIGQAARLVRVMLEGRELVRFTVDFSRLD